MKNVPRQSGYLMFPGRSLRRGSTAEVKPSLNGGAHAPNGVPASSLKAREETASKTASEARSVGKDTDSKGEEDNKASAPVGTGLKGAAAGIKQSMKRATGAMGRKVEVGRSTVLSVHTDSMI